MAPKDVTRRDAIVAAAGEVFLRYGWKKTSMEDLARAAGLSRQGLYRHFETKEALFEAVVVRLVAVERARHRAALDRNELDLEARLLGAFDSLHGNAVAAPMSEHLTELLATSAQLMGPVVSQVADDFVAALAEILLRSGLVVTWKKSGVSAKDVAEHLYAASTGLKYSAKTKADYRARMRVALKLVGVVSASK